MIRRHVGLTFVSHGPPRAGPRSSARSSSQGVGRRGASRARTRAARLRHLTGIGCSRTKSDKGIASLLPHLIPPARLAPQRSAQIALALVTPASLAHLVLIDALRDARSLEASCPSGPAGSTRWSTARPGDDDDDDWRHARARVSAPVVTLDEVVSLALLAQQRRVEVTVRVRDHFPTASCVLLPLFVILNSYQPHCAPCACCLAPRHMEYRTVPSRNTLRTPQGQRQQRRCRQITQVSDDSLTVAPKSQARVAVLAAVRAPISASQYLGGLLLGSELSATWFGRCSQRSTCSARWSCPLSI